MNTSILFDEIVCRNFAFLPSHYVMEIIQTNVHVRFAGPLVHVSVFWEEKSGEISLSLDYPINRPFYSFLMKLYCSFRNKVYRSNYPVSFLIALSDPKFAVSFRDPVVRNPADLENAIHSLADLLKKYGEEALAGNGKAFRKMDELVNRYWRNS